MSEPSFHFDTARHRLTLDSFVVPSVTTILGALPKPALKFWAAKSVAEWAYDHRDAWKDLPRDAAVDLLKREPIRFTGAKARVGTAVHGAISAHALGFEPPEDLSDDEWGYYNAALSYLSDHNIEVLRTEATVYSRSHLYGGNFDLLQKRAGRTEIADFKTSKAVYPDVALQVVAYARADFIGDADSGEEIALPQVDGGVIVRLGANGSYEAVPALLNDDVFAAFLAVKSVYEWAQGLSRRVLSPALRKPLAEAA